jgi:hypothetical protein
VEPLKKAITSKQIDISKNVLKTNNNMIIIFISKIEKYVFTKMAILSGYALNIMFYIDLKACDKLKKNHSIINKLVLFKSYFDKLKKFDKQNKLTLRDLLLKIKSKVF